MNKTQWTKLLALGCLLISGVCARAQNNDNVRAGQQVRQQSGERKVRLDVAICLDSTGSMGDEISVVKEKLRALVGRIADANPRPDVRFGLVTYRDRGEGYVVKNWDFTRDVAATQKAIDSIEADGGGDTPESVNQALHVAISELKWDLNPGVEKLLFLIGDAPPHFYPDDYDWKREIVAAQTRRISINAIGCSGIDDNEGTAIWRELATRTEGRFDYLAYLQTFENNGKKGYALVEGTKRYTLKNGAQTRWREGGARLVSLGLATESGRAGETSGANNLDTILARGAQLAAQQSGARYAQSVAVAVQGRTLARGFDSKIETGQARVLTSPEEWQKMWRASGQMGDAPKVDWGNEVVAVVNASHAKSVEISAASRQDGQTVVSYRLMPRADSDPKPDKSRGYAAYHFVALPRDKSARDQVILARVEE